MVDDKEPKWVRFVTGGAASMTAEVATIPVDTVKVRLQVQTAQTALPGAIHYNGAFDCVAKIIKNEGLKGLYKGLVPALLRQASYSSLRMGVYEPIRNVVSGDNPKPEFLQKVLAGGLAGGLGIAIANPTELVKIRMQADKVGTRYRGTLDAFQQIVKNEGVLGLWRGVSPNIQRAIIVNAAELATYDQAKETLVSTGHFSPTKASTHFVASFIAGFFAALASSPVDVIKNRLMSQLTGAQLLYTGMLDCATKSVRKEGFLSLYKGFFPNWFRLGPWCIVMFMSYEQYRGAARRFWAVPAVAK